MSSLQLGCDLIIAFVIAAALLFHYGNWYRHHVVITITVLISWYFSLIIVFILPLDVSATAYNTCKSIYILHNETTTDSSLIPGNKSDSSNETTSDCKLPWSYVEPGVLTNLWRIVYWSSQCLTWLLLPMMQSYTKAGEFTIKGKLKSALLDNAIYYGSYLFICGILLAYIAVKPIPLTTDRLKAIASSASNTWGLFLLVFMLGYGLISVPRTLWYGSNKGHSLTNAYFKVAKLAAERNSSEENLDDALENLHMSSKALPANSQLGKHLDVVLTQVPLEFRERMSRRRVESPDAPVDEKYLVKLNRQMKSALQNYHRTETQWEQQINRTVELEDIERNIRSREKIFKRTFVLERNAICEAICGGKMEWYWRCVVSRYALKVTAICAAIMSLFVIWSEATFFHKSPALSLFAIFVNLARNNYDYFAIEFVSTLTIAYLCICAYYTVFKIRVLNFYYLAGWHQTDEYSLIFAGMLLCRLTPPICLNFLGLIHMDSHIVGNSGERLETAYTGIMGHLDVLALISDGFNIYFPMGILVIGILTWFKVGARLLSIIGFQQFLVDDDVTIDLVTEGQQLVTREKRRRQRNLESSERRQKYRIQQPVLQENEEVYSSSQPQTRRSRPYEETQTIRNPNQSVYGSGPPRDLFDDV